ncbi:transketolase [Acidaminobacter sp. JC074]|uniref:transketolase n=1 Tax=Acidaminobacter sp. JC074 TaxID=2530199 RepID=UPI001F0F55AA|nr:transketolase [Acidaminobacter sp. JC074]MCH4889785.1 transketolase [Acidaminobacter sp. JC074]
MKKFINAIKVLSAEAVQEANSGHPGLPLGAATMAFTLWDRIMNHNPREPEWINRDRFILSAGHGSAMIYSLLHLYNYGLSLDDLKNFRQFDSLTPGHPEYGHTIGVETTTGPLGQGLANGVGMAAAEKHLASIFNKDGSQVIDHYTYVLVGDGCLMEGLSYEAASIAGEWGLDKLIVLYDSNSISIEGSTDLAFNEDVATRFKAMNWDVSWVSDGNDIPALETALTSAKKSDKPSIIIVTTVIGHGAPGMEGTHKVHGAPLGQEILDKMKENFNWPKEKFFVPEDVREYYDASVERLAENYKKWEALWYDYEDVYPELATQLENYMSGTVTLLDLEALKEKNKTIATRSASGEAINMIAELNKNFMGGSADLAPSNKTHMNGLESFFKASPQGRNIHFGVREHAMGSILNGLSLHGGLEVFAGTFLVFSDYMKPAIRLASLMNINLTYVFTHDSIGVGEDGPTHQPIEHLWMLRSIPGLTVFRPADYYETMVGWQSALMNQGPYALILTRQNLPALENSSDQALKGGYIIHSVEDPEGVIIASGSEVHIAVEAAKVLQEKGKYIQVVSMPSIELFESQDFDYIEKVLPPVYTLAVEAGSTLGWYKYADDVLGIDRFGASGPATRLFEEFGFTVENIVSYFE